jgi:flavin prenyltransferase
MTASNTQRLIVGISGATGIVYAARALTVLRSLGIETHLIVSRAADLTRAYETDLSKEDLASLTDHVYNINDVERRCRQDPS